MCKSISYDVIIGNLLIEALKQNCKEIMEKWVIEYDDIINKALRNTDYIIKMSIDSISEFEHDYPYFVSLTEEKNLKILENTIYILERYFRLGLPKDVVDVFVENSKNVIKKPA